MRTITGNFTWRQCCAVGNDCVKPDCLPVMIWEALRKKPERNVCKNCSSTAYKVFIASDDILGPFFLDFQSMFIQSISLPF